MKRRKPAHLGFLSDLITMAQEIEASIETQKRHYATLMSILTTQSTNEWLMDHFKLKKDQELRWIPELGAFVDETELKNRLGSAFGISLEEVRLEKYEPVCALKFVSVFRLPRDQFTYRFSGVPIAVVLDMVIEDGDDKTD